jgi:hypothetical protein
MGKKISLYNYGFMEKNMDDDNGSTLIYST